MFWASHVFRLGKPVDTEVRKAHEALGLAGRDLDSYLPWQFIWVVGSIVGHSGQCLPANEAANVCFACWCSRMVGAGLEAIYAAWSVRPGRRVAKARRGGVAGRR